MVKLPCKQQYTLHALEFQQKIEFVRNASLCTCDTLQYQLLQQWIRTSKSAWKSYTYNILYYNIEPSKKADQWIISPGLLGRWSAASKHQMYSTKPPGSEHFSLIEPRSLAACLSNCPTDHHLNQNQVGFQSHGRHSLFWAPGLAS